MEKNLMKLCKQVRDVAREAGEFIRSQSPGLTPLIVEEKGRHDYVTQVDIGSEKMITERLKKILPDTGIIGEETPAVDREKRLKWIIDPLDGTTNFLHGLPPYSISIALMDGQEVVMGVIHEVTTGDFFYSWKDAYAYHNGRRIRVSSTPTLKESLLATGFPYSSFDRIDGYMGTMRYFMEHTRGIRRMGSAAIDLSYLACGHFDGFWEYGLKIWDVAAASLIIQQAGGMISDFSGGNNFLEGKEIVAANPFIFPGFLKQVQLHMNVKTNT